MAAKAIVHKKFELEKETPGTYRYKELITPGEPPAIGTVYIKKYLMPDGSAPNQITVTVTIDE